MTASIKTTVLWNVGPCSLTETGLRFRGTCYLHQQNKNPKNCSKIDKKNLALTFASTRLWTRKTHSARQVSRTSEWVMNIINTLRNVDTVKGKGNGKEKSSPFLYYKHRPACCYVALRKLRNWPHVPGTCKTRSYVKRSSTFVVHLQIASVLKPTSLLLVNFHHHRHQFQC